MKQFNPGWYLLYTRPKFEKKISAILDENEIKHFLATTKVVKIWKDRKKLTEITLFPSYIFVYIAQHKQYGQTLDVKGAMSFVKCGKDLVRVNENVLDNLTGMLEKGTSMMVSSERFKQGENVTIQDGVLKGLNCEIVRYNGDKKVLIRMDILNRNVLADLPVTLLYSA